MSDVIMDTQPIIPNPTPVVRKPKPAIINKEPLVRGNTYNVIDDLNGLKSDITLAQLLDIAPAVRKQLSQTKPKQRNKSDSIKIDLSAIQLSESTAAYNKGTINGKELTFLFDSGAACCCLDKRYLNDIGLMIDAPTSTTLVLGDQRKVFHLA